MAFGLINALGAFVGARNKARHDDAIAQQKRDDELKQQQWLNAYNTQQQGLEKQRIAVEEAGSGVTYDPATGKATLNPAAPIPKSLQEVAANNKGKKQPAPGSLEDLQQRYAHASAIASYYAGQPGAQNQEMSRAWMTRATQYDALIRQAATAQDSYNKELMIQAGEDRREGKREGFEAWERTQPTYGDTHARPRQTYALEAAPADAKVIAIATNAISHAPKGTAGQVAGRIIANIYSRPGMDAKTRQATIDAVRALVQQYSPPNQMLQLQP